MESLTVIAQDRIGLLLEVTETLGREKINIESISLEVVGKKAVITLVVDKPKVRKARDALGRQGLKATESDTFVLKLPDKPGELSKVAKILTDAGISTESVHIVDKQGGKALCEIKVDLPQKAEKILREYM